MGLRKVGHGYFQAYGIRAIAGRLFSQQFGADLDKVVLNQTAVMRLGFASAEEAVGGTIRSSGGQEDYAVIGVVPDIQYRPLRQDTRDEVYFLEPEGPHVSLRYRTEDLPGLLAFVDGIWHELYPDRAITREFLDEMLAARYLTEERQGRLLAGFAALAVVIACLGLYGLASLTAEQRTREIVVRKVLGASVSDIVKKLVWQFSKPVLMANLIAWPVTWYFMRDWLSGFAHRIDLTPVPFVLAGVVALGVAWVTVAGHAIRVARTNPTLALRCE